MHRKKITASAAAALVFMATAGVATSASASRAVAPVSVDGVARAPQLTLDSLDAVVAQASKPMALTRTLPKEGSSEGIFAKKQGFLDNGSAFKMTVFTDGSTRIEWKPELPSAPEVVYPVFSKLLREAYPKFVEAHPFTNLHLSRDMYEDTPAWSIDTPTARYLLVQLDSGAADVGMSGVAVWLTLPNSTDALSPDALPSGNEVENF